MRIEGVSVTVPLDLSDTVHRPTFDASARSTGDTRYMMHCVMPSPHAFAHVTCRRQGHVLKPMVALILVFSGRLPTWSAQVVDAEEASAHIDDPGSKRVVVHVGDEGMHDPTTDRA